MNLSEDELKLMWQETKPIVNEEEELKKVLNKSSNTTAAKDVTGLFFGWIWVVFLGFGASMYSAKRKLDLHKKTQLKNKTEINQQGEAKQAAPLSNNTGDKK
ncbi:hypothetical protein WNY51_12000 [Pseudocolwellia sp. AS88]|uniref:hypothetical protein n=1 Tax=Pseudocolwellia sp. AS88 TaxID=3063958 RepID=UPI0026EE8AD1|nr:hypothetical protein [Pseudocolwellia sp. AS88]MDO7085274.1 hypothetical protein [Pseudocolwellia sp. AS88]